jgi:hypothetical protein
VSHAAPELEALLPDEVGGSRLSKGSATGAAVFGDDAFSREVTAFLSAAGKQPGALEFANARGPAGALGLETGVFRVAGVDAAGLLQAIVDGSRPSAPGLEVSTATIAGKPVTVLAFANGSRLHLYARGDSVFYVGGTDDDLARTVLATFP